MSDWNAHGFDLVEHLRRQKDFSLKTFGPGARTKGVLDHIRKELAEIEAAPDDISEWIDVIILAFDGAWRAGWEAPQIVRAIVAKQTKNEARKWPDWRTMSADKAIEHDRSADASPPAPVSLHGRHFTDPGPVVVDTPDPRDAALKLAREALAPFSAEAGNFDRQRPDNILLDMPVHLRDLRKAAAALAAIDAITGGGNAD